MDAKKVIAELEREYPGAVIKVLPEDAPTEIVCEFDPKERHPDWSLAVAIIDESKPHFHKHTTETYHIVRGHLKLFVGNQEFDMYEGQQYVIMPGNVHWAKGNETWVEVYCSPGYSPDDHIMA